MTTAFQKVVDYAESISINRKAVVSQTISRNQTVRAISRGGQVWRFDIKLPDGIRWSELRPYIEAIDAADRFTSGNISLNTSGTLSWFMNYQGDVSSLSGWTATATQGSNTLTSLSTPSIGSGYRLRAGDLLQLGSGGKVYSVVSDVAYNGTSVTLNRPVLDSTGSKNLIVGPNVVFKVICQTMPNWNIFARDQVAWDGSFIFAEDLT